MSGTAPDEQSGGDAKQQLRASFRAARRALAPAERIAQTQATVRTCLDLWRRLAPPAVASYLATPGELDLDAFHQEVWRDGGTVLLSRVAGPGLLAWHAVGTLAQTMRGAHGIREPDPDRVPSLPPPAGTLMLVPGVAFGADGRRLGQGGGYYDRFLAAAAVISVGVGFACQRHDRLDVASHDRHVDGVVLGGELLRDPTVRLQP